MELDNWRCTNGHEAKGSSEAGKKAPPCPVCGETFDKMLNTYLANRLHCLRLCGEDGKALRFKKSEQPASVLYAQFLKLLFGSHGVPGSVLKVRTGVSA